MDEPITKAPSLRLMSWNMGHGGPNKKAAWEDVRAEPDVDVALLQEAPNPYWKTTELDTTPRAGEFWGIEGVNRAQTAIALVSEAAAFEPLPTRPIALAGPEELGVSRPGTITAAKVTLRGSDEEIVVVSVYAQWEGPLVGGPIIFSDASMHRILSDLTPLLSARQHPVIVAGDFNTVLGSADDSPHGNWTRRNAGVFDRLEQLDLRLAGPQHPYGERADPHPDDLPAETMNVPTHETSHGRKSSQLDYVYVTPDLVDRTAVVARNSAHDWGPSDHCRLMIEVAPPTERRWTVDSFLDELAAADGEPTADAARALINWADQPELVTELSRGVPAQWAAVIRHEQYTFWLRSDGQVVIPLQWYFEPFDGDEAQREIISSLNRIPGVDLSEDRIGGRPSFPIRLLSDRDAQAQFLSVFDGVVRNTLEART